MSQKKQTDNGKINLKKLSLLFIFISSISIAIIISVVWGFFFNKSINKEIEVFNKNIHIKKEKHIERSLVSNTVNMINLEKEMAWNQLKSTLKERDYRAWKTAKGIYLKYKGKKSFQEIKERILDALRFQVFDRGKGYYFITSLNGVEVLSPEKDLIGKNLLKIKKYRYSVLQEINVVKKYGEGFVIGKFLKHGKPGERIAYVKIFKPFDWYIGCGRFITTFKRDTEKKILKEIKYAKSNLNNPTLFIVKLNYSKRCPAKIIFYSNPEFDNHTCISSYKNKFITYPNGKPCIADCLNKLEREGSIFTQLIWPFHKNKLKRERITYLYYYKPFNWVIGSCGPENFEAIFPNFKDTLKENIKSYTRNLFLLSLIISIFLAAIIWVAVFLQTIYKSFKNDTSIIRKFFEEYKEGTFIDTEKFKIKEVAEIGKQINHLFKEINEKNREINNLLEKFEKLAENMPTCLSIFELNKKGELVLSFTNSKLKKCPAIKENLTGKTIDNIFTKTYGIKELIDIAFNYNETVELTTKCPYSDKIVSLTMYKLDNKSVVCMLTDTTESANQFREREKSKKTLEIFLDKIRTGIIVLDKKANLIYINILAKRLLGIKENETLNINKLKIPEKLKYMFLKILHGKDTCESCDVNLTTVDGRDRWFEVSTASIKIDRETLVIISFNDITQKYIKNKQLEYLSFHDTLTGLYNRRYFEEELRRLFNKRNYPLTLLLFDLNGLKIANDILGHEMGDKLILKISEILSTSSRGNDIVARIGGDEFAILMPNTDEEGVKALIKRIEGKIEENNKSGKIKISASYGFATQYGEFEDPDDLFKEADKNMYLNKYSENRKEKLKEIIKWALNKKGKSENLKNKTHLDDTYFLER